MTMPPPSESAYVRAHKKRFPEMAWQQPVLGGACVETEPMARAGPLPPPPVPKECGYGNFTRRSRTGSVVVCVAPSPARGSLWHKPLTHRVGLATCLAGVGHTPIPSHPPPAPSAEEQGRWHCHAPSFYRDHDGQGGVQRVLGEEARPPLDASGDRCD